MSSTFQRFHCLSLDPINNSNNNTKDNSSENKNNVDNNSAGIKLKDMNFPPLKSGGEKRIVESSVQVPIQKYSINRALENYFRVEVTDIYIFCT